MVKEPEVTFLSMKDNKAPKLDIPCDMLKLVFRQPDLLLSTWSSCLEAVVFPSDGKIVKFLVRSYSKKHTEFSSIESSQFVGEKVTQ